MTKPYWKANETILSGKNSIPPNGGILVIGSGLAGASVAYFLKRSGFNEVSIVDNGVKELASFRNAGHVLHGAGESFKALKEIHGEDKALKLLNISDKSIQAIKHTVALEGMPKECFVEYPYYRIAIDEPERQELYDSYLELQNLYDPFWINHEPKGLHVKEAPGTYICIKSGVGQPAVFRNGLMASSVDSYFSYPVQKVEEVNNSVEVTYQDGKKSTHDAVVLATNGYSQLIDGFFQRRKTIEPFKGQILVSKPFDRGDDARYGPFSMDHGYIYGTYLPDNRLLIGGWRNNVPGGEVGCTDLTVNKETEEGLKQFVNEHFTFEKPLDWEYSWAGIMGSSTGGVPHVGPTDSDLIFTCAGFSGYGFGWAHGCAKICADIMAGNSLPEGWEYLKPR